jgi:AhpC/TSA family protein/cytochrome c biogenesis DsbD-like protein
VQLQGAKQRFEAQGIKLAAISYDGSAILRDFADRHKIEYPLLADPQSQIIASYGVLNREATGMTKGMALPGYFYIDANGIIREQYFEAKYTDRFTANNVLAKVFPELAEEVSQKIAAPHLGLELSQSDGSVAPGSRFNLAVQVELPPDVHVYAPGVKGYKPIQLELHPSPEVQLMPPNYPASKILYLEAIKEEVPVFEGKFRITSDAKISANPDFIKSLGTNGKTITIGGQLSYQACDKTICYPPTSVLVSWQLEILPLDRQRSPEAIQHK